VPDQLTSLLRAPVQGPTAVQFDWRPKGKEGLSQRLNLAVGGLFAGIGGFEEGFRRLGHHPGFLCESDPMARRVLERHFPGVPVVHDVRELDSVRNCAVITAGFPCQDLSQVGRTEGINGNNSGLVKEVFRLLRCAGDGVRWLILENVPFMLHLHKGAAIREITRTLDRLGWRWAYRTLDSRAFGLPQRRRRFFLVASRTEDPRPVLLGQDAGERVIANRGRRSCGFYWTEGHRGLGWAIDSVPPLKGGSGVAIPSPPAIWSPPRRTFFLPSIEDAERLQGFTSGWTQPACEDGADESKRWRLVGNAVSVPVAAWLAGRLLKRATYDVADDVDLARGEPWPEAAWHVDGRLAASKVSSWPIATPGSHLATFLEHESKPLSLKAAAGFLARLEHSTLRRDEQFVEDLRRYVAREKKRTTVRATQGPKRVARQIGADPQRRKSTVSVDPSVSRRMAATPGRDNLAERALRSALHKRGYRFRIHRKVLKGLHRTADIAFVSLRVAIFLDGCFWHGCPVHATWPKKNARWWRDKIETNRRRDRDTDQKLKASGWTVIRVWEHESPEVAVRRMLRVLRPRNERLRSTRSGK
jgi:DNA (cytosine-5)-methyltransferase 1